VRSSPFERVERKPGTARGILRFAVATDAGPPDGAARISREEPPALAGPEIKHQAPEDVALFRAVVVQNYRRPYLHAYLTGISSNSQGWRSALSEFRVTF
jgi:hypothetical protein